MMAESGLLRRTNGFTGSFQSSEQRYGQTLRSTLQSQGLARMPEKVVQPAKKQRIVRSRSDPSVDKLAEQNEYIEVVEDLKSRLRRLEQIIPQQQESPPVSAGRPSKAMDTRVGELETENAELRRQLDIKSKLIQEMNIERQQDEELINALEASRAEARRDFESMKIEFEEAHSAAAAAEDRRLREEARLRECENYIQRLLQRNDELERANREKELQLVEAVELLREVSRITRNDQPKSPQNVTTPERRARKDRQQITGIVSTKQKNAHPPKIELVEGSTDPRMDTAAFTEQQERSIPSAQTTPHGDKTPSPLRDRSALRAVRQKMEDLQRSKSALEERMRTFEGRVRESKKNL
eukprot:TRINITY_DN10545_c0_g2_i1.p1 TRINITY_DN10545_c0_g2~~TRINITY_DN10545_c0_g2_i1.p1  ORF type:complete len:354 (-),score=96.65 TRINITY_DN10545_c0_g2_i1:60-1121(-)